MICAVGKSNLQSPPMKLQLKFAVVVIVIAGCSMSAHTQQDLKGSSDHPFFPNRMPGYSISNYEQQGFRSYRFRTRPPQAVEGKYTRIHYYLRDMTQHPGGLAIRRNYENAIKTAGGVVVHSDSNVSVMKATRNGVEVWAELQASESYAGRYYFLHIIETRAYGANHQG